MSAPFTTRTAHARGSELTRQRLLATATDLFLTDSYAAVSLRRITERAGLTHGAIARHFATKPAVADAVLEQLFRHAHARVHRYHVRNHSHLVATISAWVLFVAAHPGWVRLELDLGAAAPEAVSRDRLHEIRYMATAFIEAAMGEAGVEPAVAPESASAMLLTSVVGYATAERGALSVETAAVVRTLVEHVLAEASSEVGTMSANVSPRGQASVAAVITTPCTARPIADIGFSDAPPMPEGGHQCVARLGSR
ncbi:TetR/AcrR family transcriptional regulator [Nocardia nepalensis]|uniref:TetR/AcrR family transcriptional regulator n=1 Tax=Nocardia nepalensis TaxID=3375448 RepID=UPI003B6755D2